MPAVIYQIPKISYYSRTTFGLEVLAGMWAKNTRTIIFGRDWSMVSLNTSSWLVSLDINSTTFIMVSLNRISWLFRLSDAMTRSVGMWFSCEFFNCIRLLLLLFLLLLVLVLLLWIFRLSTTHCKLICWLMLFDIGYNFIWIVCCIDVCLGVSLCVCLCYMYYFVILEFLSYLYHCLLGLSYVGYLLRKFGFSTYFG